MICFLSLKAAVNNLLDLTDHGYVTAVLKNEWELSQEGDDMANRA